MTPDRLDARPLSPSPAQHGRGWAGLRLAGLNRAAETAKESPSFTVVVPTFGRPRELARCLSGLAAQDYPLDRVEVVVVDDGSPVPAAKLASPPDGPALTLLRTAHHGPAAARNLGVARARGDVVAFTDDDCLPDPGWLRALAAQLAADPGRAVAGWPINALVGRPCAQASQFLVDCLFAHHNADHDDARFLMSNDLAIPAGLFRGLGGFDERFPTSGGEDRDLGDRLHHAGHPIAFAPDAVVHHFHDLDLPSYWRQYFRYGRGAWRYHRNRAERGSGTISQEAGFYRALRRRLRPAHPAPGLGRTRLVALLVVWQVANTAGFAWEAMRHALAEAVGTRG